MEGGTSPGRRSGPARTSSGPGRLLVLVYGVFALSATARAAVQIATKFDEAPLAYVLSALAAVVYVCATVGLARSGPGARRLATVAVTTGALGVLTWLPSLVVVAVPAGMVRGIVTLLQATAVTDRWGARDYGTLSGVLAAPLTFTTAVAPFLGAALAVLLGSYAAMLLGMAVVGLAAAALSLGSVPPVQLQRTLDQ